MIGRCFDSFGLDAFLEEGLAIWESRDIVGMAAFRTTVFVVVGYDIVEGADWRVAEFGEVLVCEVVCLNGGDGNLRYLRLGVAVSFPRGCESVIEDNI